MGMKEMIGLTSIRIGDIEYTDADLDALPVSRLEELKIKVNSTILEISAQLRHKERELREAASSDPWYISAKHAQSINQRFLPYLSQILRRRRESSRSVSEYFVDAAKDMLEEEDFKAVMTEAQRRKSANEHP